MKKAVKKVAKKKAVRTKKFWRIGENYFIRTVTNYITGRLVVIDGTELIFEEAAWIANTGRFANMLQDPSVLSEIEPYPDQCTVLVNRQAVCDATQWPHPLPRLQR